MVSLGLDNINATYMNFLINSVLICLLSMICAQYSTAQTYSFSILGQVISSDSVAVSNCPITLWSASDSTLIYTILSDVNGQFVFRDVPPDGYFLNIGSLQYKKQSINVNVKDSDIILPCIVLEEYAIALDEFVVAQNRPLIKVQPGEVHYYVNADPLAKSSSLYQVFQRLPLISVSNGGIKIKGNVAPTFFINGVPAAHLNGNPQEVLKSIRSEQVKEIQIITTPGAKYDADFSGGVINIVTKRDFEAKSTGSIGSTLNTKNQYSGVGTMALQLGRMTLQGNISYGNQNRYKEQWDLERTSLANPINHFFVQGKEREYYKNSNLIASTLLTWEPNSNDLMILGCNYLKLDTRGDGIQKHSMYNRDNLLNYQFDIQEQSKTIYESIDAYYSFQHKWGKKNVLLLMYQYKNLPKMEDNTYLASQVLNYQVNDQHFKQTTNNIEHTLQGDVTYSWKDIHSLNGGVKGIIRVNSNDSKLQIRNNDQEEWQQKNDINDLFSHNQYILGFYTEYRLQKVPWDIRVGIRDEWTKEDIEYKLSLNDNFDTQSNVILFSFGLNYSFSPSNSIGLYYRSHISRPSIRHLNPKISISDPSYLYFGNPHLKSEKHHSWSLNWSIYGDKGFIDLTSTYRYSRNSIQPNYGIHPSGEMYRSYNNGGKYHEGKISANGSYNFSNLISASLSAYVSYRNVHGVLGNNSVSNSGYSGGVTTYFTLSFPKGYYLNIYGGYDFPSISLEGTGYNFYHCGAVLSKSFFSNRLNLSFTAIDFLWNTKSYKRSYETPDFQGKAHYQNYGLLLELGVTYRFNLEDISGKKVARTIQNKDVLSFDSN